MKCSINRFLLFFLSLLLFTLAQIFWKEDFLSQKKKPQSPSFLGPTQEVEEIQTKNTLSSSSCKRSLHGIPAPLDEPSEEELLSYPGASVVETAEISGLDATIHLRILKTNFKSSSATSGLIRTVEIIDQETGELVDRAEMIADHLLVSLPDGKDPEDFLTSLGNDCIAMNHVTPQGSLYEVTLSSAFLKAIPEALKKITCMHGVSAGPNFMIHSCGDRNENIPSYIPSFWYLENQWGLWKDHGGINAYDAWQVQRPDDPYLSTIANVPIVAICDTGIRYTHEDLVKNMWCDVDEQKEGNLHGIDMIDKDNKSMDIAEKGHGTHIAGIIGGTGICEDCGLENGVIGVAPKVQLMACRCMNDSNGRSGVGTESDLIACMDYAIRHGATILNCSLIMIQYLSYEHVAPNGLGDYDRSYSSAHSDFLLQACQRAEQAGVIIVAAAGNAGNLQKTYSRDAIIPEPEKNDQYTITTRQKITKGKNICVQNIIQYNNDLHPTYPASYRVVDGLDNIISVAASTFAWLGDSEMSVQSNYGAHSVDIAAPGCEILSTSNASDTSYVAYSGTSMATAFVSGALVLLKEHYPHATYLELIQHLLTNADHDPALQGKIIDQRHLNIGKALQTPLLSTKLR